MGIADDMKKVAQELISSYQAKICEVATIIDNTHQVLEDFRTKRNEMSEELKEILAKEGSLRKKDFDNMIKEVLLYQDERENEVRNLLKAFFEEQKEIAEFFNKSLREDGNVKVSDFKKKLQDIQVKQRAREIEVSSTLRDFQDEYNEMAESLRSLLNKGEAIQVGDFKEMIRDSRSKQLKREKAAEKRKIAATEAPVMASPWDKLAEGIVKKELVILERKGG